MVEARLLIAGIPLSPAYRQTPLAVLAARRDALVAPRTEGAISAEVMVRVVRDLGLEESRLQL